MLKKIVALSTMSQIWFFVFLAIGSGFAFILSFIHIIRHFLFKSLLFMQVGYLIFVNCGSQDYRGYSYLGICAPILVQLQIFVSVVCLCGLLFTSGCCSKEYFMSRFYYGSFNFFGFFSFFCFLFLFIIVGFSFS
ncbi:hypothetical protein WUBG_19275 [Wuchereria bancrofti]|uniref:NADH:ubiquinone reductase (H(+)-translocating) n=1 Tax=Wuchereria bancrofti TaxID=6293 RepID=J9A7C4_WUCBA|nr:hypothetical protein WUBG_19275 [Wuchereria bancrofti]